MSQRQNLPAALSEGELLDVTNPAGSVSLTVRVPIIARAVLGLQVDGPGVILQGRAHDALPWVDLTPGGFSTATLPSAGIFYYVGAPPEVRAVQADTPVQASLFYTDARLNQTLPTIEIQGAPGARWFTGTGPPGLLPTARDGDLYLDFGSGDVYERISGNFVVTGNIQAEGSDKFFLHEQNTPALEWTVPHNLGRLPTVAVINQFGHVVLACVEHLSENVARITNLSPQVGKAIFT